MSRTIKTLTGQEVTGLKGSFYEDGDHIIKKEPFGGLTRIRKDLVVEDRECSTALEVTVSLAAVGVAIAAVLMSDD